MKRIVCLILSLIMILGLFSGCGDKKYVKYTDYSFEYFDTVTTIIGFETSEEEFQKNVKEIKAKLEEYHKLYDIYNSYEGINNLYTINKLTDGNHQKVVVDKKIINLLQFAQEAYPLSFGKINAAMGGVLKIWHDYRNEGKEIPSENILKNASEHADIEDIIMSWNNSTVLLNDPQMLLDVGAIAKGYTAEEMAKWMIAKEFYGYLLNIGGNVKVVGDRPDGEKWDVAIENPDKSSENPYIETLKLGKDMSLVTSGSYQRYYTVDGKQYHHIIDPDTLMPAEFFRSVSVLCTDSGMADLLSTALFCLSYDDGLNLLKNFQNVEVMWIKNDDTHLYTEGFKNYCIKQ